MIIGTAASIVGTIALYSYFSRTEVDSNKFETIELLMGERDGLIHAPSVNTITFYHGKLDVDMVKEKTIQIIRSNMWLCSRLVTSKSRGLVAIYPKEIPDDLSQGYFSFVKDSSISANDDYEKLSSLAEKYTIKKGSSCIDKDERLFSVTVLEIIPNQSYALIVSLSHTIGDGFTFYSLYGMLCPSREVVSMSCVRNHQFVQTVDDASGPQLQKWLANPLTLIGILSTVIFRKKPTSTLRMINSSSIENMKSSLDSSSQKSFVSTNDILTSWFFQICHSDFGLMAINFRNRFPQFTNNMAGNYESVLLYSTEDGKCPQFIRESIQTYRSRSSSVPTWLQSIQFNVGCVTNWSSFYQDLRFPGVEHVVHFPLYSLSDVIFRDIELVFRPRNGELAVLILLRSCVVDDSNSQWNQFLTPFH